MNNHVSMHMCLQHTLDTQTRKCATYKAIGTDFKARRENTNLFMSQVPANHKEDTMDFGWVRRGKDFESAFE